MNCIHAYKKILEVNSMCSTSKNINDIEEHYRCMLKEEDREKRSEINEQAKEMGIKVSRYTCPFANKNKKPTQCKHFSRG